MRRDMNFELVRSVPGGAVVMRVVPDPTRKDEVDPGVGMRERFPRSWGSISHEDAEEMIRVIEDDETPKRRTTPMDPPILMPDGGLRYPRGATVYHKGPTADTPEHEIRAAVARARERFPRSFGALSEEDAAEMIRVIEEECERVD